jgi:hypothetical protein
MAVKVSKLRAVKRLMYLVRSIEDYTTRCKLKLAYLSGVKMRRNGEINRSKVQL